MTEDAFDAEGQLTSAVNYVTSDADRTVYTVTGHGEEDLSSVITDAIDKANLSLDSVSPHPQRLHPRGLRFAHCQRPGYRSVPG